MKIFHTKTACLSLILLLNISVLVSKAQSLTNNKYYRDYKGEYEELYNTLKKSVPKKYIPPFASAISFNDYNLLVNNEIDATFANFEEKLLRMVNSINKTNTNTGSSFQEIKRIFITRNPDVNCYVSQNGTIYINMGLLSEIPNEAALAAVIGHEISHYQNEDVINRFVADVKRNVEEKNKRVYEKKWYFELIKDKSKFSQEQERIADSIGAMMAGKAGYSLLPGQRNFLSFYFEEKLNDKQDVSLVVKTTDGKEDTKSMVTRILSSHPENLVRYNSFYNYISKFSPAQPKDFIVFNKSEFDSLNKMARNKVLHLLNQQMDYQTCLEKAFLFHLFDPEDETYVYYILESSRRLFELNKSQPFIGFLSEKFNKSIIPKGHGVLSNMRAFVLDSVLYSSIKAKELLNSTDPVFYSYDEAFDYFADLAVKRNYKESMLTIALRNMDIPELKNKYLNKYVLIPNVKCPNFAKSLLKNTLTKDLKKGNRKLLIVDHFIKHEIKGENEFQYDIFSEAELEKFYSMALKYENKDSVDLVFMSYPIMEKYQQKTAYRDILNLLNVISRKKLNEISSYANLWTSFPQLWELFYTQNLSNVFVADYMYIPGQSATLRSFFPFFTSPLYKYNRTSGNYYGSKFRITQMQLRIFDLNKELTGITASSVEAESLTPLRPLFFANSIFDILN